MFQEFLLPDGKLAECPADVDKFLKENDLVLAQDYSDEYREKISRRKDKAQRDDLWADFLNNYKRMIWNDRKLN